MLREGGPFLSWGRFSDSPAGLELTMEPRWTDPNLLQTSHVVMSQACPHTQFVLSGR